MNILAHMLSCFRNVNVIIVDYQENETNVSFFLTYEKESLSWERTEK